MDPVQSSDQREHRGQARGRPAAANGKRPASGRRHKHRPVRVERQRFDIHPVERGGAAPDHRLHAGELRHRPLRPFLYRERRWRIEVRRTLANDGGQSFVSLRPPQASVTALAVSNDEQPTVYVATFQPSTHVAWLWTLHDTGAIPQGPAASESPVASGGRTSRSGGDSIFSQILGAPQLPYVGLGLGALAVVLTAVVAHLRGRYR